MSLLLAVSLPCLLANASCKSLSAHDHYADFVDPPQPSGLLGPVELNFER